MWCIRKTKQNKKTPLSSVFANSQPYPMKAMLRKSNIWQSYTFLWFILLFSALLFQLEELPLPFLIRFTYCWWIPLVFVFLGKSLISLKSSFVNYSILLYWFVFYYTSFLFFIVLVYFFVYIILLFSGWQDFYWNSC